MDCPRCGLFNPPSAEVCDCGFNFAVGDVVNARLGALQRARTTMFRFGLTATIGVVVTVGTVLLSVHGGVIVIAWGAIVVGLLGFMRSWQRYRRLLAQAQRRARDDR